MSKTPYMIVGMMRQHVRCGPAPGALGLERSRFSMPRKLNWQLGSDHQQAIFWNHVGRRKELGPAREAAFRGLDSALPVFVVSAVDEPRVLIERRDWFLLSHAPLIPLLPKSPNQLVLADPRKRDPPVTFVQPAIISYNRNEAIPVRSLLIPACRFRRLRCPGWR